MADGLLMEAIGVEIQNVSISLDAPQARGPVERMVRHWY